MPERGILYMHFLNLSETLEKTHMQRSLSTRYLEILWVSKCSMMCVCGSKCDNISRQRSCRVSQDVSLSSLDR